MAVDETSINFDKKLNIVTESTGIYGDDDDIPMPFDPEWEIDRNYLQIQVRLIIISQIIGVFFFLKRGDYRGDYMFKTPIRAIQKCGLAFKGFPSYITIYYVSTGITDKVNKRVISERRILSRKQASEEIHN